MPPTAWYVQLFGSYMPDENQFVRTLSMVKLHHPQSGSFLTANVAMVNDDGDPVSSNLTMLQAVSQGDATASGSANSNFIWVLERQNNRVGGIAQWSMDFKLRHYNTGLFLCAGHKSTPVCKDFLGNDQGEDGFVSDACIATELLAGAKSAESSRQAAGLFKLQPLSTKRSQANDDRIPRNAGFRLKLVESKNGDLWLRKGDELFQEEEDIMLNGIEILAGVPSNDDAFTLEAVDGAEYANAERSLNMVQKLSAIVKSITRHTLKDEGINVGDKVKGKVVVVADYGAFVEVATGVEGLLHVSEMSWSQHLRSAQDFLKVGDEIETVILGMDMEERKMSLGMKQLVPDPWENIEFKYPEQSKHTGKVRNFTNFGLFVEMEDRKSVV